MQKIGFNMKQGTAKVKVENQDDLWYLSNIVDQGDFVKGKTLRKVQMGTAEKTNQVKKQVFLKIKAEKIEFSKNSLVLRIGGKVIDGPDDIPHGSWHSFTIEPGATISIQKQKWLSFQLDKLNESFKQKIPKILICVFDREEAFFALMKKYGYELLAHIKGNVQKKAVEEKAKGSFYAEIIKNLEEYSKRHNIERVILASPAFWKEELMKELKDSSLKSKIIPATCSSVSKNGIDEVLRRPETAEALREERAAKEIAVVEEVLSEISKEGKASYGMKETRQAAEAGAVEKLVVSDRLIQKMREKEDYGELDSVMKLVDSSKGSITIVSSEHEGGKKLDGLGGIAAVLRYKINY